MRLCVVELRGRGEKHSRGLRAEPDMKVGIGRWVLGPITLHHLPFTGPQ